LGRVFSGWVGSGRPVSPCLTCRVGSGFWALGRVGSARASLFDVSGWVRFWGFGSGRPVPPCLACWSDRPVPLCLTCRVGFFRVGSGFWALVGSGRPVPPCLMCQVGSSFFGLGRVFGLWVRSGWLVPCCLTCWVGLGFFGLGRVFGLWVGSTRASLFDVSSWVVFWGFGSGRPVPPCLACWSGRPVPLFLTCRVGFFRVGLVFWALGRVGSARASLFDVSGWVGFWCFGSGRPVPP
jgi:hypothetical protein